jgi:uncharacterized membrane protein
VTEHTTMTPDQRKLFTGRRLAVLAVLSIALFLAGTLTVFGAPKADFSLSPSPSAQTITAGGTAAYAVAIERSGGFAAPVAVTVAGLPAGAKASLGPASPITGSTTTVTVTTAAGAVPTPAGTYDLTVTATSGSLSHTASLRLTVQPQQAVSVAATPATRDVSQDDATTYAVSVQRLNGFTGAVTMSVSGLPKHTTATWSSTTIPAGTTTAQLSVATAANAETGSFALTFKAVGAGSTATASAVLNIGTKQDFTITGQARGTLAPGATTPIDLRLTNPNNFPIRVTGIDIAIAAETTAAGCGGTNFSSVAFTGPIDLPARATSMALAGLVPDSRLPRITMLDRAANQDACKGARVGLRYTGTAVKS